MSRAQSLQVEAAGEEVALMSRTWPDPTQQQGAGSSRSRGAPQGVQGCTAL